MKDFLKKFQLVIPVAILGVIWTVLVLVLADYEKAEGYFWCGFAFGLLAFIIVGAFMYLIPKKNNNTVRESGYLAYIYTIAYGVIAVILNTVFVIISSVETVVLPLVLNFILLAVYAGIMWFTLNHMSRVSTLGKTITDKVVSVQMIAVQIGSCVDLAEDEDIRAELKKLKEFVDYSDQVGISATKETEERFRNKIFEIQTMIEEKEEKEAILKEIKSASHLWKTRNSMIATLRG